MASTHHFHAHKLFDVKGYVCVVTGGGTGANGAKVYITGRRLEVLENAAKTHDPSGGGQIIPLGPCDVTQKDDLQRIASDLSTKEPHLHLLMCNAGIGGPKANPDSSDASDLKAKLWANESVDEWQETYKTDVTSVYFTTLAFLPMLQAAMEKGGVERFGPSVITTSSMSGLIRHAQGHFAYNAAKGATAHLTKLMSAEFQKAGVRVNSIAPGYFPSEMTAKESDEKNKSELPKEKVQEKGHVPLERGGRDEEMGMTVLFLAKNLYLNGQVVTVDGGVLNVVGS